MNIEIRYRWPMRLWQQRLAESLRADGHRVRLVAGGGSKRLPLGVGLALSLQRKTFGPSPSLFDAIKSSNEQRDLATPDLAILLDGEDSDPGTTIEPLFDGAPGEAALVAMLSCGRELTVGVRRRDKDGVANIVSGLVVSEDREILSRGLDQAMARVITLIVQAVRRTERGSRAVDVTSVVPTKNCSRPLSHMASGFIRKAAARIARRAPRPAHWRIGFRRRGGKVGIGWSARNFTILPDDGERFYADPMLFEHEGRSFVFFEDFPYATGKGVIGVVEIATDGTVSTPRTVLEQPYHLSYPLIVEHAGEIYMLPEMSAAKRIQLFRADPFPDCWVPDRVLVEGATAADATPILHKGRWWLFTNLSDDGGSTWDALGLFHAPDLLGPWTPHVDNPVIVDASAARPAGAMWHENGALMRVAQDCRGGYGRGLAICRVDRLDEQGYTQKVVARLAPPTGSDADGVHTINRVGSLEAIDLKFLHAN